MASMSLHGIADVDEIDERDDDDDINKTVMLMLRVNLMKLIV